MDFKPDWLFHLGAHTDLEYCETHADDAYQTNTLAVENAVHLANELDIPVFYVSTAGIFDGGKELYDDWDTPNPLGHYARSKHEGEKYVAAHARRYLICRAGWMMGAGPSRDKKFIKKIHDQIVAGRKELFVVTDKLGTPTYTRDFAANVRVLMETGLWGIYNLVCEGETSRFEVAQEFVRLLGKEKEIRITAVDSDHFKKDYFAPRPPSERLVNRKLSLRGLNRMRHWKPALAEYVAEFYRT